MGRAQGRKADPRAAKARVRLLGAERISARHMADARTFTVDEDDDGIRLDRWFKRHMPDVSFNLVSRWARTGQLRVAGKRAVPGDRVEAGQEIRVPPLDNTPARTPRSQPRREP